MPTEIITTCTKKKMSTSFAYLRPNETFSNQKDLSEHWKNLLSSCPEHKKVSASDLYRGRGFKRAVKILNEDFSKLHIISAGLGLVSANDKLVPYNLTTSIGTDNHVKNHLPTSRFDVVEWWDSITQKSLHELIESSQNIFIIACSRAYLEMILNDLLQLSPEGRSRIRIVGNELEQVSDYELFEYVMPYDIRLNSIDSAYRGSKIDFAQRAAHHLYNVIQKYPDKTSLEHQQIVFEYMESLGNLEDVKRNESVSNEDLRDILIKEWKTSFGRPYRLLQLVRQKYGFSCSESRLNHVVNEIREDIKKGVDVFDELEEPEELEGAA